MVSGMSRPNQAGENPMSAIQSHKSKAGMTRIPPAWMPGMIARDRLHTANPAFDYVCAS